MNTQTPEEFRRQYLFDPHERYEPVSCRSCGRRMGLALTLKGRKMPVDLDDAGRPIVTHFATCPEGKAWSRKGKGRRRQ